MKYKNLVLLKPSGKLVLKDDRTCYYLSSDLLVI